MMQRRGQAAFEFLMTYGWAMFVVITIMGILVGGDFVNFSDLRPQRTQFSMPIPNVDQALLNANENSVEIAMRNSKGVGIELTGASSINTVGASTCQNPVFTATYDGSAVSWNTTVIPNGGTFLVKWDCDDLATPPSNNQFFEADLGFDYTNTLTGQTFSHRGSVQSEYNQ